MHPSETVSTKTLYKLVKQGLIQRNKLRRKGRNNSKNHKETRGRINDCKTIHQRDEWYPKLRLIKNTGTLKRIPLSVRIVNHSLSL